MRLFHIAALSFLVRAYRARPPAANIAPQVDESIPKSILESTPESKPDRPVSGDIEYVKQPFSREVAEEDYDNLVDFWSIYLNNRDWIEGIYSDPKCTTSWDNFRISNHFHVPYSLKGSMFAILDTVQALMKQRFLAGHASYIQPHLVAMAISEVAASGCPKMSNGNLFSYQNHKRAHIAQALATALRPMLPMYAMFKTTESEGYTTDFNDMICLPEVTSRVFTREISSYKRLTYFSTTLDLDMYSSAIASSFSIPYHHTNMSVIFGLFKRPIFDSRYTEFPLDPEVEMFGMRYPLYFKDQLINLAACTSAALAR